MAEEKELPLFEPFGRDSMAEQLRTKINNHEAIVVHIFVPLCDNEHQGIVPVNAELGNGSNLNTNLYWGARYGIKTFFIKDNSWKYIGAFMKNDTVMERIVFNKKFGGANVYLIADAYRGERMKNCLSDFMNSVAQLKFDSLIVHDSLILRTASSADLLIFNGHNGLMDTYLDTVINKTGIKKDVAVIGCVSYNYFYERLNYAGGYPVLTTNYVMAPEAYCADALISAWIENKSENEIVEEVALAYANYQKCGLSGAKALFVSGWRD